MRGTRGGSQRGLRKGRGRMHIPFLLFAFALQAFGAEYFVSTTGLDSNGGSLAAPWRTIQKAANTVAPGDTVSILSGTYAERVAISGKRATAGEPIVFRTRPGDVLAAIDQTGVTPPNGTSAVLTITNCDFVTVQNLEVRNYKTTADTKTPIGILVNGDGFGVKLLGCKVHDIWQSNGTLNNIDANGFGVLVNGDGMLPIANFVLDGCEVSALRTGASESVVLNGNVTGFSVTNNLVHDCNNIGIDFIGFEGTAPTVALDQARNGVCSGNTVWNIDSKFNPAYGGNFVAGGGNATRSAPGLYVDGGRDIVLERNHVYSSNFAVSLGSEHLGKVTSNVAVRNNILHHCHVGGLVLGGSDNLQNGGATGCTITNNTLYENDTTGTGGGQVSIQNFVTATTIRQNIIVCNASTAQFVLKDNTTGSFSTNAIDWNLYSGAASTAVEFIWNNSAKATFTAWKTASAQDANSFFSASAGLAGPAFTAASPAASFALLSASLAVNSGDPAFAAQSGERDFGGQSRVASARVDIGADELLSPWQAWRDQHFAQPDGGAGANAGDDAEGDGMVNLLEFALGGNPLAPDAMRLPTLLPVGAAFRFQYRKEGSGLTYSVEKTIALPSPWTVAVEAEQTDGAGNFWRDFTGSPPLFVRLRVVLP